MEMSEKVVTYAKKGKSSQVLVRHLFLIFLFSVPTQERVLGIINLLSSLGRMWVSGRHCLIVWGHVSCSCCIVLLLSKPAWFCG